MTDFRESRAFIWRRGALLRFREGASTVDFTVLCGLELTTNGIRSFGVDESNSPSISILHSLFSSQIMLIAVSFENVTYTL